LHEKLQKMIAGQMLKIIFALSAAVFGFTSCAHAQDTVAGESSFRKCLICHAIGENATNKIGPELNGLDGRRAGSVPDFNYSTANKNSEIVWNDASFKEYIKDPNAKVPGTKMIFSGIKNEKEADDLWAYLKQFDSAGRVKE
jgi:cytochrome c